MASGPVTGSSDAASSLPRSHGPLCGEDQRWGWVCRGRGRACGQGGIRAEEPGWVRSCSRPLILNQQTHREALSIKRG